VVSERVLAVRLVLTNKHVLNVGSRARDQRV
jgi:hypothetical protein